MKTLTKTMIALGVLGATVIGTAGPTFARDVRGHAFGYHQGAYNHPSRHDELVGSVRRALGWQRRVAPVIRTKLTRLSV